MHNVIYYIESNGYCPVREFIDDKKLKNRAKILALIKQLEIDGPNLPRPYADLLEDGIHELRIRIAADKGGTHTRILYFFFDGNNIILTNGFMKTTDKVPKSEIKKAKKYRTDYLKQKRRT